MSDSSSSHAPHDPAEGAAHGKSTGLSTPSTTSLPPAMRFDQPTVISKVPPLPGPVAEGSRDFDLARSLEGERLNHFEVQEFVGGGGMGAVYRALDTSLNRIVALKLLSRDQAIDEETVRRFRNEAQSAARLDHENIARAYYVGEDRGLQYIAFEFIGGRDIRELVEQRVGPLPLADALSYTLQVAEALAHASARDVVHRDIKPSNILVTQQGRAKLVDMGLARLHQVEHSDGDLTASGVTLGTFDYISPEQARDPRSADTRSDIYSLGCTLYYMLTARPPFPEGTVLQKLLQHQGDEPPDPTELNPDIPPEVARLVSRMLAKDPGKRFQSATELVGALVVLGNELGLRPLALPGYAYEVPPARPEWSVQRHLPWMLPVALLLIVVGVLYCLPNGESGQVPAPVRSTALRPRDATSNEPGSVRDLDSSSVRTEVPAARANRELPPADDSDYSNPMGNEPRSPERTAPAEQPSVAGETRAKSTTLPSTDERIHTATDSVSDATELNSDTSSPSLPSATVGISTASLAEMSASAPQELSPTESVEPLSSGEAAFSPVLGSGTEGPRVLVVGDEVDQPNHFLTLRAACQAAQSGDIIELRYNGRRIEQPIQLQNLRLTIRAGEGYAPIVTFRPDEPDPLRYARSMIAVTGRQLGLFNLGLELDLPREIPADSWSLLSVQQIESLRLERCSLTIRNADQQSAYHDGVSFVDVLPPVNDDTPNHGDAREAWPAISIQLQNCVARGEAVFLRSKGLQPIHFSWDNGLLATTERMLSIEGGAVSSRSGEKTEIELRHITASVRRGLCLLSASAEAPSQLPTTIHCTDCIVLAAADAALLEQRGQEPVTALRGAIGLERRFQLLRGV